MASPGFTEVADSSFMELTGTYIAEMYQWHLFGITPNLRSIRDHTRKLKLVLNAAAFCHKKPGWAYTVLEIMDERNKEVSHNTSRTLLNLSIQE